MSIEKQSRYDRQDLSRMNSRKDLRIMKQKNCLLFVLVLCLAFTLQTNAETIEYFAAIDFENKGYKDFQATHPDVAFEQSGIFYNTTGEFAGALLTKEFTSDLFSLYTSFYYCQQIMKKEVTTAKPVTTERKTSRTFLTCCISTFSSVLLK